MRASPCQYRMRFALAASMLLASCAAVPPEERA